MPPDPVDAYSVSPIALIPAAAVTHSSRAVRAGSLVSVSRGVYAPAKEWAVLAPWQRYHARVLAAHSRHPEMVLHLESALVALGLPIFGEPKDVHVLGDETTRSRISGGVRVHTTVERRAIETRGTLLVPSIADVVVDVARSRHPAVALAVADAALRCDPGLTVEQLVAVNEVRASSRGRNTARWALHRASPLAESPLESVDRAVIEWLGFPEPLLQVWVGNDRVDKWWPEYRIAGEGDGDGKYERAEDPREAMRRRHARDARLFAAGVGAVPHWGWPEAVAVEPLHALLSSAGLPVIRPRQMVPLASLRRLFGARGTSARENPTG